MIAILSIHRGDRPLFLQNLNRMIKAQTMQPDVVHFVDYPPTSTAKDITQRYRIGYNALSSFDIIIIMEVDDWYAPNYIETVYNQWLKLGRPDMLGQNHTIYYNIKLFAYFVFNHNTRSSMMNTAIRGGLNIHWPIDTEPYTDTHLWVNNTHLSKQIFNPSPEICLGIKHGVGLLGGGFHVDKFHRFTNQFKGIEDYDKKYLRKVMDADSFNFYSQYFENK